MSRGFIQVTPALADYILTHSLREPPALRRLREETAKIPMGGMQISPVQGQFMGLLVKLTGATRYLEVGTFTGYSSLAVALAMPPEGRLVCCDMSEEWTAVAKRHWKKAGVADKVDLRLAPAAETLDALVAAGFEGTFDIAFIDADKKNYDTYYERALSLLRRNGLVLIDNVLWGGSVADPKKNDADTAALKALNAKIHADQRVDLSMLTVGDGLTLARKR